MKDKNTILITGVGGAAGVFLIRHLQKCNLRVVAVDSNAHSYGLLHGDVNYIVPSCLDKNYLKVIRTICEEEKVNLILPLIDEELLMMKSLESPTLYILCPTSEFIQICVDKHLLMQELKGIDLKVPKTLFLSQENNSLQFPVIVKPRSGRGSRNVSTINNNVELEKLKIEKTNELNDYIVQEKIIGDEYTVSVVTNINNDVIAVVPKKIILKEGITKVAVTEKNYRIDEVCKEIIRQKFPGNSFNVQLIMNKEDNEPYIFEINPRYSTTTTLTIQAGIDEILAPIEHIVKASISSIFQNFQEGMVVVRGTLEDFMSLDEYNHRTKNIIYK